MDTQQTYSYIIVVQESDKTLEFESMKRKFCMLCCIGLWCIVFTNWHAKHFLYMEKTVEIMRINTSLRMHYSSFNSTKVEFTKMSPVQEKKRCVSEMQNSVRNISVMAAHFRLNIWCSILCCLPVVKAVPGWSRSKTQKKRGAFMRSN